MKAFEEWWKKHLYRGDLCEMAREAYLAATERAAGIAENESLFAIDDTWVEASAKIAQKIRDSKE
jgi:hypothetical protein